MGDRGERSKTDSDSACGGYVACGGEKQDTIRVYKRPLRFIERKNTFQLYHGCERFKTLAKGGHLVDGSEDCIQSNALGLLCLNMAIVKDKETTAAARGDDFAGMHPLGCTCAGENWTKAQLERVYSSTDGHLCCGTGCPAEELFYKTKGLRIARTEELELEREDTDKRYLTRSKDGAFDIASSTTPAEIFVAKPPNDWQWPGQQGLYGSKCATEEEVLAVVEKLKKTLLDEKLEHFEVDGHFTEKELEHGMRHGYYIPRAAHMAPIPELEVDYGLSKRLEANSIFECQPYNPHFQGKRIYGCEDLYELPMDKLRAQIETICAGNGKHAYDPAALAREKGYNSAVHATRTMFDDHLPVRPMWRNGVYNHGVYNLRDGMRAQAINTSEWGHAECFQGIDHPFIERKLKEIVVLDARGQFLSAFGEFGRRYQKWPGTLPRAINAEKSTEATRDPKHIRGMDGYAAGSKKDKHDNGRLRDIELYISPNANSAAECGTALHSGCWSCWGIPCSHCQKRYADGFNAWGPGVCSDCGGLFSAPWTIWRQNDTYEWAISGSAEDFWSNTNTTSWAMVYKKARPCPYKSVSFREEDKRAADKEKAKQTEEEHTQESDDEAHRAFIEKKGRSVAEQARKLEKEYMEKHGLTNTNQVPNNVDNLQEWLERAEAGLTASGYVIPGKEESPESSGSSSVESAELSAEDRFTRYMEANYMAISPEDFFKMSEEEKDELELYSGCAVTYGGEDKLPTHNRGLDPKLFNTEGNPEGEDWMENIPQPYGYGTDDDYLSGIISTADLERYSDEGYFGEGSGEGKQKPTTSRQALVEEPAQKKKKQEAPEGAGEAEEKKTTQPTTLERSRLGGYGKGKPALAIYAAKLGRSIDKDPKWSKPRADTPRPRKRPDSPRPRREDSLPRYRQSFHSLTDKERRLRHQRWEDRRWRPKSMFNEGNNRRDNRDRRDPQQPRGNEERRRPSDRKGTRRF